MKNIKLIAILVVALAGALFTTSAYAKGDCTVDDPYDKLNPSTGNLTFRTAVDLANQSKTNSYSDCYNSIEFDLDALNDSTIELKEPININVPSNVEGSKTTIGASLGVIELVGHEKVGDKLIDLWPENKQVIIDASQVVFPDEWAKTPCAIAITGNYITLKNIKIVNSPAIGLCIFGTGTVLDNVDIEGSKDSAIVIADTAAATKIGPNTDLISNALGGANAVIRMYAGGLSGNSLTGTILEKLVDSTDKNGFAGYAESDVTADQEKKLTFTNVKSGESLFMAKNVDSQIVFESVYVDDANPERFTFTGGVSKSSLIDKSDELCDYGNYRGDVERIQVYGLNEKASGGVDVKFITYVTDINGYKPTEEGVEKVNGLSKGGDWAAGYFNFVIDKSEATSKFKDVQMIMLIPEFTDFTVGQSSKVIKLNDTTIKNTDYTDCGPGGGVKDGSYDPTGGDGYADDGTDAKAYKDYNECYKKTGYNTDKKPGTHKFYDTDKDGIPDGDEDTTAPFCKYNKEGDSSDLFSADTDNDGISDTKEQKLEIKVDEKTIDCIREADCDGGSIPDGWEDRNNRIFMPSKQAYLFKYWGNYGPLTVDGELVKCELYDTNEIQNGVAYHVYKIIADSTVSNKVTYKAVVYNNEDVEPSDKVDIYECRNSMLAAKTNFNGIKDGPGELDMTDPDDDQFYGVCNLKDAGTYELEVNGIKGCKYDCIPGAGYEVLLQVKDLSYVKLNPMGLPEGLADTKIVDEKGNLIDGPNGVGDGKPDLEQLPWKDVIALCSDRDGDKIPDCIENPTNQCIDDPSMIGTKGTYLDPYKADSDACDNCEDDGDDYSDSNPFTAGEKGDLKTFINRSILSCFVDRDGDGLRDCEEDPAADGVGVGKTKTSPLNPDTDGDEVGGKDKSDWVEVNTSGTNPLKADSDGDKLSDKDEISYNGSDVVWDEVISGSVSQCAPGVVLSNDGTETNLPTVATLMVYYGDTKPNAAGSNDSDGDGIPDGVEVTILGTNPNNPDSDGDGLEDGVEKLYYDSQELSYDESNPCAKDTDGDKISDFKEKDGCANNASKACDGLNELGPDKDQDGIPDDVEVEMGTDPDNPDTDGDNLADGCIDGEGEMCWHVKKGNWANLKPSASNGESSPGYVNEKGKLVTAKGSNEECPNDGPDVSELLGTYTKDGGEGGANFCGVEIAMPCGSDTDGDGLPDYWEKRFGTSPNSPDTDADGIPDGLEAKWVIAQETKSGSGIYYLKSVKGPEEYMGGSMTDPTVADTDGDGLLDGAIANIDYEDKNCNGKVDVGINGVPLETDPRMANSDGDSQGNDYDESHRNGVWDPQRALIGQRSGCASVGGADGETWGMTLMFLAMLAGTRVAAVVIKRTKRVKGAVKSS